MSAFEQSPNVARPLAQACGSEQTARPSERGVQECFAERTEERDIEKQPSESKVQLVSLAHDSAVNLSSARWQGACRC